jgi:hypothetical protein
VGNEKIDLLEYFRDFHRSFPLSPREKIHKYFFEEFLRDHDVIYGVEVSRSRYLLERHVHLTPLLVKVSFLLPIVETVRPLANLGVDPFIKAGR